MRQRKFLLIPYSAWHETIVMLGLMLILNALYFDGHRWVNTSLHPFWIVVVLISAQYGLLAGLMSVAASTAALYVGNLPAQTLTETFFDYQFRLSWLPCLWCITAFSLGQIRSGLESTNRKLEEDLEKLQGEADRVVSGYEKLKAAKEYQEMTIASQRRSATALYQTFKFLQELKPSAILREVDKIILTALNPQKFSIYANGESGFEAATCHGWEESDHFLSRIPKGHPLYQQVAEKQRLVCVVNSEDEAVLDGQGLIAAPLVDKTTGEVFGLIKIEAVELMEFNLPMMEIFKTLCELIGVSYSHARQYKALKQQSIYGNDQTVYSSAFYAIQRSLFEQLSASYQLPCTQIVLAAVVSEDSSDKRPTLEQRFVEFLDSVFQSPAQIFRTPKDPWRFFILLPGVPSGQAEALALQAVEALQRDSSLSGIRCNLKVESLSAPSAKVPARLELPKS